MENRPVISATINPRTEDGRKHIKHVLDSIGRRQSIWVDDNPEHPLILSATSESNLSSVLQFLRNLRLDAEVGDPKVIYLETIRSEAEAEGKYIKQTGGSGNYGHVKLRIEPLERGGGYQFVNEIGSDIVPAKYIDPIRRGIEAARLEGALSGDEITDIKITLYDGSYHHIDSNETAFKIAASIAFRNAEMSAGPIILEPMMAVEITSVQYPTEPILRDLRLRRGRILDAEPGAIHAVVPLAEMLGYEKYLDSVSRGEVTCSVRLAYYAESSVDDDSIGSNGAGVTANKPWKPNPKHGSTAADLDFE